MKKISFTFIPILLLLAFSASGADMKKNIFLNKLHDWVIEHDDKPVRKPNEVKNVKAGNSDLIMIHIEKAKRIEFKASVK